MHRPEPRVPCRLSFRLDAVLFKKRKTTTSLSFIHPASFCLSNRVCEVLTSVEETDTFETRTACVFKRNHHHNRDILEKGVGSCSKELVVCGANRPQCQDPLDVSLLECWELVALPGVSWIISPRTRNLTF